MSATPSAHSRALFTGLLTGVRILPAPPGLRGIHFRRVDLPAPARDVLIPAHVSRVVAPADIGLPPLPGRCTILGDRAARVGVATVEHVLSALAGLGVRDALVEVDGPEVPIFDGSALPFVEMVVAADAQSRSHAVTQSRSEGDSAPTLGPPRDEQHRPSAFAPNAEPRMPSAGSPPPPDAQRLMPDAPLSVSDASGARIDITPCAADETPVYAYTLDYASHPDPRVRAALPVRTAACPAPHASRAAREFYAARVAPARTFCLASEARAMQQAGLFTGLTPRDMLVLDDATGAPIDNAFRAGLADGELSRRDAGAHTPAPVADAAATSPFEPAVHKLLDLVGDLALLGAPLHAHVRSVRGGHALTHEACRAVLAALGLTPENMPAPTRRQV